MRLDVPRPASLLSSDEAARVARFHFEKDRIRWSNARSALRSLLASYAGEAPESLRFVLNSSGKPSLEGRRAIQFNLSHAGDFALAGVSPTGAELGVDIERIRPEINIGALLARLGENELPENVPDLFQRWTQREARSKAVGGPLFVAPPPDVYAFDIPAPDGYRASVATRRVPVTLTLRSL